MHIEWNKVTWYSKLLAVLVFLVTFFLGFEVGVIYQQAKDYSIAYSNSLQSVSSQSSSTGTSQSPQGSSIMLSTPTHYDGMLICKDDSGCPTGYTCTVAGPLIAGQPVTKVCASNKEAVPL